MVEEMFSGRCIVCRMVLHGSFYDPMLLFGMENGRQKLRCRTNIGEQKFW